MQYFHSVRLDQARCLGCTNCIKRCPTEAIRVREGKALIIEERCIDCGECIRICPNNAKTAYSDLLSILQPDDYNIALPAPSLFGQFKQSTPPEQVVSALQQIGFHDVYEVARAADYLTCAMRLFLKENRGTTWISSSCPAVVRLIQVRFPELLPQLLPLETPMELAAQLAKQRARLKYPKKTIKAFFITPCPAKTTAVHQPEGSPSHVDGTFSISEVYTALMRVLPLSDGGNRIRASRHGLRWALSGGETLALGETNTLAVDGVHDVVSMLEELELGRLEGVDFIEAQACPGGCLGGPLTVTNHFVSYARLKALTQKLTADHITDCSHVASMVSLPHSISPRPILPLDSDVTTSIRRMEKLELLLEGLPGLDCGACGAPNCRALAEDIVRGLANETDCIIKLRERVKKLAEEMVDLSTKLPPAMGRGGAPDA